MSDGVAVSVAASGGGGRASCAFGSDLSDGACRRPGVARFGRVPLCEEHFEEVAARERTDHWEEVDLLLEMWLRVASAWENDTLLRLSQYARLEAETERELEREALERAAKAGRTRPRKPGHAKTFSLVSTPAAPERRSGGYGF